MSTETFNPYAAWLGLRTGQREPHHYELLGLQLFEADEATIRNAADAVRAKLLPHLGGAHAVAAEALVAHINRAERCLLNKKRKELYDDQLRAEMALVPPADPSGDTRGDALSAGNAAGRGAADHGAADRRVGNRSNRGATDSDMAAGHPAATSSPQPRRQAGKSPRRAAAEAGALSPWGESVPQVLPPSAFLASGHPSQGSASPAAEAAAAADDDAPPLAAMGLETMMPGATPYTYVGAPGTGPASWSVPADSPPFAEFPSLGASAPYSGSPPMGVAPESAMSQPFAGATATAMSVPWSPLPASVPQAPAAGALAAGAVLTPSVGESVAPVAEAEPALAVRGSASIRRAGRSRGPNWFFLAGIPMALVVVVALTVLWAMQIGPFAPATGGNNSGSGRQVAQHTSGSNGYSTQGSSSQGGQGTHTTTPRHPTITSGGGTTSSSSTGSSGPATGSSGSTAMGTGGTGNGGTGNGGTMQPTPSPPDAQPTPMPTPMPAPPPNGDNPPMPNPPSVQPDSPAASATRQALQAARYYLAHRDMDRALEQLTLASRSDPTAALGAELQRVQRMHNYVSEFWKAVRRAVGMLTPGDQVTIQNITVGVVEILPNGVILRRNGRNERHTYDDMKSGLALGLAESVLDRNDAVTHLVLGAFLAMNPTSQRDEARAAWERARQLGAADEVALLLPELDVPLPESLENPSGTPTPTPGSTPPMPLKVPPAEQVAAAREQVRKNFRVELFDATTPEAKRSVATQLLVASEEAGDPALRYAYYLEAMHLSVEVGDYDRAFSLAEDLAKIFSDVPLMDLKAEALEAVVKSSDDIALNRTITEKYLELSDEARLREQFAMALRIVRLAQITARKTRDAALIKEVNDRLREVQEAMRSP
jgi:curved DNA-binding protein CbpA